MAAVVTLRASRGAFETDDFHDLQLLDVHVVNSDGRMAVSDATSAQMQTGTNSS
jgi:hypothetical protein